MEDIQKLANDDHAIDLDKIKKYFKSVINEQNYLKNYERIKLANSQQQDRQIKATQQERLIMEKRQNQIANAKQMFIKGITTRERCNLSNCMPTSQSFMNYPRASR